MGGQGEISDTFFVHQVQCAMAEDSIHGAVQACGQVSTESIVQLNAILNRYRFPGERSAGLLESCKCTGNWRRRDRHKETRHTHTHKSDDFDVIKGGTPTSEGSMP